ncbi:MAG: NAD+ synthase [Tepidisphaeraceae bacterium]|jgi:NAD+ synthetase
MKIALAQINPTVGDIAGNTRKILDFLARAEAAGAHTVVFPELCLTGYPPKDLLLKPKFVDDNLQALEQIARSVDNLHAIIGFAQRNANPVGRPLHNAVALLHAGRIVTQHFKTLLPTYDVFDETRYFEPGSADRRNQLVRIGEMPVGLSICEDLWNDERLISRRLYHQNPIADLHAAGAQLMINSSASPFVVGKHDFRIQLFSAQARQFGRPLVYVNQVGGNDELVFDGNSVVFDAQGRLIAQARDFEEDLLIVDLPVGSASADPEPTAHPHPLKLALQTQHSALGTQHASGIESIYKALVLGLKDYLRKCGFKSAVLGLSGGIDSAVTCALAAAALGADKVVGVAMPSRFSSDHSVADARTLAENLGVRFHIVPVEPMHKAYETTVYPLFARASIRGADPADAENLTDQNVQARVRGGILMAFSNRFGHLLLTTGNKSELAVGYCTLYGDMCGGLAVISDVPKTTIYELAEFINRQAGRDLIPRNSISKPPSAELRPNQTDQDSLPPYDLLDAILHRYVEEENSAAEIVKEGFDAATVLRVIKLCDRSEYKRRQAAPGLKVTSRAFGFGRRMPIAQNYRQTVD